MRDTKPRFDVVKEKDDTWSIYTQIGVAYCRVSGPHTERTARLFANAEEMEEMLKSFNGLNVWSGLWPSKPKLAALLARIEGE